VQGRSQASHRRAQVQWLDMCQHLLNCYENELYDFFRVTISVDEKWIHYHSPHAEYGMETSTVTNQKKVQCATNSK
jgi:hypothetical protein